MSKVARSGTKNLRSLLAKFDAFQLEAVYIYRKNGKAVSRILSRVIILLMQPASSLALRQYAEKTHP